MFGIGIESCVKQDISSQGNEHYFQFEAFFEGFLFFVGELRSDGEAFEWKCFCATQMWC